MISGDGRYVAFMSRATNLVSGDTNGADDVFVHDLQTGQTERVSVSSTAAQGLGSSSSPNISSDGRYVVFSSSAINLVSGDTNLAPDVFVRDRQIGVTTLVSVASDGTQGSDGSSVPDISADGRWVVFFSAAGNLVSGDSNSGLDVFVHDRQAGATSRVSVATGGQQAAGAGGVGGPATAISDDGRYVAFHSDSSDLVTDDTNAKVDVFVHD
jgi:Tol biopolymer transport system component